jgi:hypothetical protein
MNAPTVQELLDSPSVSFWLKDALRKAVNRDCVDAARDAELLAATLRRRADEALGRSAA